MLSHLSKIITLSVILFGLFSVPDLFAASDRPSVSNLSPKWQLTKETDSSFRTFSERTKKSLSAFFREKFSQELVTFFVPLYLDSTRTSFELLFETLYVLKHPEKSKPVFIKKDRQLLSEAYPLLMEFFEQTGSDPSLFYEVLFSHMDLSNEKEVPPDVLEKLEGVLREVTSTTLKKILSSQETRELFRLWALTRKVLYRKRRNSYSEYLSKLFSKNKMRESQKRAFLTSV